jgi:Secretion system C-terminal sorting domain
MNLHNTRLLLAFSILLIVNNLQALHIRSVKSGDWYDTSVWDANKVPTKWDAVTISTNTHVKIGPVFYTDCDSLTVNGTFETAPANFTIGGRDLQIDARAVRNTELLVNGKLIIKSDWNNTFKVYGNVRFAAGSSFEMTGGQFMIDGCGFVENLSVPANKPLLDVSATMPLFSMTGGGFFIFNPHFHKTGLCVKGTKHFSILSFGHNSTLPNFAARVPNDFIISETEKPTFEALRLAYLPHSTYQNKVILNNVAFKGGLDMTSGVLAGSGFMKIGGSIQLTEKGRIERDIELNGTGEQQIANFTNTNDCVIKGNIVINNSDRIRLRVNLSVQNGAIQFQKGNFDLNGKNLSLDRAPTGADSTRYFFCQNNLIAEFGTLRITNVSGNTIFPVGTEKSYNPVILNTAFGDFSVFILPTNVAIPTNLYGINTQWQINRNSGTAPTSVSVQWKTTNETPNFTTYRANARLHRYNGTTWEAYNPIGVTAGANGSVYTKLTNNIHQFSTFSVLTQTVIRTNTTESSDLKLAVFPNPVSSDVATVSWDKSISNHPTISVSDALGKVIFQKNTEGGTETQILTKNWAKGVYVVRVFDGEKTAVQKIVKD